MLNFDIMLNNQKIKNVLSCFLFSKNLNREVLFDLYLPEGDNDMSKMDLLLINDGQDLLTMPFNNILNNLYDNKEINKLFCIGIHCGMDRKNEYATANKPDYKGRGAKAAAYTKFIMEELLPFIYSTYSIKNFKTKSFAGFSLGGLSALDIVWNHPEEFARAGIFSGSLWWRVKDQSDVDFDEWQHRIMHRQIRDGIYAPHLKFFFEAGAKDETADRNNNGIIDSIDDTIDLMTELNNKGYGKDNVYYLELPEGRHDVATWALALPVFLKNAYPKSFE